MEAQITQQKIDCENASPIRDGRVYCWFKQDWVEAEKCLGAIASGKCSVEHRKRVSMEW